MENQNNSPQEINEQSTTTNTPNYYLDKLKEIIGIMNNEIQEVLAAAGLARFEAKTARFARLTVKKARGCYNGPWISLKEICFYTP